ncbi:MAG: thioredoxin, partial [Flavobacteriales bacterium]|nr:thioredoxin [Flavobacteriales bacterium]
STIIKSDKPVLVDFYADWCGPCKVQGPILEELAREVGDNARILKVDVDRNQALASQLGIRSIPTLVLFKNGEVKWREAGVHYREQLLDLIKQFGS